MIRRTVFFLICIPLVLCCPAQEQEILLNKVRQKMDQVKDYRAEGIMKTDVSFLNVPVSSVEVFFRKPDELRIKKTGGISIIPKGGIHINLFKLMQPGTYVSVDAGVSAHAGIPVRLIKLLPAGEQADILLATLYIDETKLVVRKVVVTTRDNGTLEMLLDYGKFLNWALPDKVSILFSTKDYKLPKGFTFEYEGASKPGSSDKKKNTGQGRVEITYNTYSINKGLPDDVFK